MRSVKRWPTSCAVYVPNDGHAGRAQTAPSHTSKGFLRYSFSIARAANMQKRRCRNAGRDTGRQYRIIWTLKADDETEVFDDRAIPGVPR
jgi:hypothetical protein